MADSVSQEDVTFSDFKYLLQEDDFVDYFNKFNCLPVFKQLVLYNKRRKQFSFEPDLPKQEFLLNTAGLIEWLWKRRCQLFKDTRFFVEYLLGKNILKHNLYREDCNHLEKSDQEAIKRSLSWLLKKCFGRASALRKFRRFLQRTTNGYKMYLFWLEAERLYQGIKRKSDSCLEKLNYVKETFFMGTGDLVFPDYLMNLVWENMPKPSRKGKLRNVSRHYGVTFTICMQHVCFQRLCSYWVPRYLLNIHLYPVSLSDQIQYELAMRYLHGQPPFSFKILKDAVEEWKSGSFSLTYSCPEVYVENETEEKQPLKVFELGSDEPNGNLQDKLKGIAKINKTRRSLAIYASRSPTGFVPRQSVKAFRPEEGCISDVEEEWISSPTDIAKLFYEERDSDSGDEFQDDDEDDDDEVEEDSEIKALFLEKEEEKDTENKQHPSEDKNEGKRLSLAKILKNKLENSKEEEESSDEDDESDPDRSKKRDSIIMRSLRFQEFLKSSLMKTSDLETKKKPKQKRKKKLQPAKEFDVNDDEQALSSSMIRESEQKLPPIKPKFGSKDTMGGKTLLKAALRLSPLSAEKPFQLASSTTQSIKNVDSLWGVAKDDLSILCFKKSASGSLESKSSSETSTDESARNISTPPDGKRRHPFERETSPKQTKSSIASSRKNAENETVDIFVHLKDRRLDSRKKPKAPLTTFTFTLSGSGDLMTPLTNKQKKDLQREQMKVFRRQHEKRAIAETRKNSSVGQKLPGRHSEKAKSNFNKRFSNDFGVTVSEPIYTTEEDHTYRHHPSNWRMIEALQTDHAAGHPYQRYLLNSDNEEMVDYLNFWQDVEKSRQDYDFGTMDFENFSSSLKYPHRLRSYSSVVHPKTTIKTWFPAAYAKTSRNNLESIPKLNMIVTIYFLPITSPLIDIMEELRTEVVQEVLSTEVVDMPWQLRKLQMEAMEKLKNSFEAFTFQDIQTFRNNSSIQIDDRFSTSAAPHRSDRRSSVQRRTGKLVKLNPISANSKKDERTRSYSIEPKEELESRMRRAKLLVVEGSLPYGRTELVSETSLEDDDVSDDEGHVKTPPPPKRIGGSEVDLKTLAAMSVKEYPCAHPENFVIVRTIQRRLSRNSDNYFKPIKKGGIMLLRPQSRPISFAELLRDTVHLEFFKKFLKVHRSDTPMHFWLAVESLKFTDQMKKRQDKAKTIIRKYFQNPRISPARMLQCTADIVREIPFLSVVTTSMLTTAQTAVAKALETTWFRKYASTFPESPVRSSFNSETSSIVKSKKIRNDTMKRTWNVFKEVFMRAARFLRYMKDKKFLKLFHEFLLREAEAEAQRKASIPAEQNMHIEGFKQKGKTKKRPYGLSSIPFAADAMKDMKKVRHKLVNGQFINYDHLVNDLKFWLEILCYRRLADDSAIGLDFGTTNSQEFRNLKKKATLIVNCFLDSNISPGIRVNVPVEVCEITIDSLYNGLLDRALFHEATVYVFPLLLVFWKKFCLQYYTYAPVLSKKNKQIYGYKMTPTITPAIIEHRRKKEREKRQMIVQEKVVVAAHSCEYVVPNLLENDVKHFLKHRRSSVDLDEYAPRISFSLSKGIRLFHTLRFRRASLTRAAGSVGSGSGSVMEN